MPSFSPEYLFDVIVLTLCLATSIPAYVAFVRRFDYHAAHAVVPVVLNCLAAIWIWSLDGRPGGDEILAHWSRFQMFFTCWFVTFPYLYFLYCGYRYDVLIGTVSNTQILIVVLALPIIGVLLTGLWLFWTRDKQDEQKASKANKTWRRRFSITLIYWLAPVIVLAIT
jgi:hypothetical protein